MAGKDFVISQSAVSYYHDPDSGNLLAVVNAGIWRLFSNDRVTGPWTFFPRDSRQYDYFHQKIFRQHHAEVVYLPDLDPAPPPLPPTPEGPFPTSAELLGQGARIPAGKYPNLARWIGAQQDHKRVVQVVLFEDLYESAFGDGRFLDFHRVFDEVNRPRF